MNSAAKVTSIHVIVKNKFCNCYTTAYNAFDLLQTHVHWFGLSRFSYNSKIVVVKLEVAKTMAQSIKTSYLGTFGNNNLL